MNDPAEFKPPSPEAEANVSRLIELTADKRRDLQDRLEIIGTGFNPLGNEGAHTLEDARLQASHRLEELPQKSEIIAGLITKYNITTPIDPDFFSDLLLLTGRHLKVADDKRDPSFNQHEKEMVKKAEEDLKIRRMNQQIEREGESELNVGISNERQFNFFVSEDGKNVRMELPILVDPNKHPVSLGPEAVTTILGSRLTYEDYETLANTFLSLKGEAGVICRAYAQAVEAWAELHFQGQPSEAAFEIRKRRSYEVRKLFGGDDPAISPFVDIPLNAINIHARKSYSPSSTDLPQPFES